MFLITSKFEYCLKNEDGVRTPCEISNENGILTLINKYIQGYRSLLVIANDPTDYIDNDNVAQTLYKAFGMTNKKFDMVKVLDNRTLDQAEVLIQSADLIFMRGGEILRQLQFLQQIDFKGIIENYHGVVVSVSAASMCLTKTICNFPEHEKELNQPRVLRGLNIVDIRLIPHVDGETLTYQGHTDFANLVQDHILPYSDKEDLCALPNGSFIMFDGHDHKFFGPCYKIYQRKMTRFH